MLKYFCDRCGEAIDHFEKGEIRADIPDKSYRFEIQRYKHADLCRKCGKEYLELFEKFMGRAVTG